MRATLLINGRVQGVGYRSFINEHAPNFRIRGSVRNLGSGSVEIFVEGEDREIERFVEFLRKKRPSAANTDVIEVFGERDKEYRGPWKEIREGIFIDWHGGD